MEMPEFSGYKNVVVNSSLAAGGDIPVGDKVYVATDFRHSVLFLRVEAVEGQAGRYVMNLSLKTQHGQLRSAAVGMLYEQIELVVGEELFHAADRFQDQRRQLENSRFGSGHLSVASVEAHLSTMIHDQFLSGDIGAVLRNFLTALQAHKITELLLVVSSPDTRIRNLPWEMALDRIGGTGVIGMQGFGLVRTRESGMEGFDMTGVEAAPGPLKLLFVTALPENLSEHGKRLELEDEQRKLIEAVGHLEATGDRKPKMVIEFLDVASVGEIEKALRARSHDVLHISGHGGWLRAVQQGILYLEDDLGDKRETPAEELAGALKGLRHLKLVVLSACETAVAGEHGTADVIAREGVPAVLAMRFSVTDAGAKGFTTAFYTELAKGKTITEAVDEGRRTLWLNVQEKRAQDVNSTIPAEWFTPVLYLNQYVAGLVDPRGYHFPDAFYTHSSFLKEGHTKLIGGGFIGRKRQRIDLRRAFEAGAHVCLVGMGGMGKTTLAEAFAHNYDNHSHKVIIWRGEQEITELGILTRIVEHFRVWQPDSPLLGRLKGIIEDGQVPILNRLDYLIRNCLAAQKNILIFDNFEDLQWQEGDGNQRIIVDDGVREMLIHLLVRAPRGCHVLFTTRYRIEGLPASRMAFLDLDKLSEAEQYRLMNFSESLRWIGADDRERIYARLDGLPRAFTYLEGIANHDPQFQWDDLERDLGKVEADVFADLMLGRIYGLLSAELQRVFLVASVFFTRTPVEALVSVAGDVDVRGKLADLMGWSLCFFDAEEDVFEVHALTREWVVEEGLFEEGERKRVALGAGEFLIGTNTFGNARLAMEYFRLGEAWESYTHSAMNLYQNLERVGLYDAALEVCNEILSYSISEDIECSAYSNIGKILLHIGQFDEALSVFERGLEIAVRIGKESTELAIRNGLSKIFEFRNNHNLALEQLNICLSISRKLESREEEQITLNNIGNIYLEMKDAEKAKPILEQSLRIAEQLRDGLAIAGALAHLGYWEKQYGNATRAIQLYERSLQMHRENEHRQGEASILNNLGRLYMERGELAMAVRYFQDALEIMEDIGNQESKSKVLFNLACVYQRMDEFQLAWDTIEECQKVSVMIQDYSHQAMNLLKMGELLCSTGQFEDAIPYLIDSRLMYSRLGMPDRERADAYLNAIIDEIGIARYNETCSNLNPKVH